jgi:hypothetical protein
MVRVICGSPIEGLRADDDHVITAAQWTFVEEKSS